MDKRDIRERRRFLLDNWQGALDDSYTFRYSPDAHYQALLDIADEFYHSGVIGLGHRQELVTRALGAYSFHVEEGIAAEIYFNPRYYYELLDGDQLLGTVLEGHITGLTYNCLGVIWHDWVDGAWHYQMKDADLNVLGRVEGLQVIRPVLAPLTLRSVVPPKYQFRDWRETVLAPERDLTCKKSLHVYQGRPLTGY
ncbi:hypothetical protein QYE80_21470 [Pseudomonas tohonis]|nr:hypothetical protein [Pseudomonas tohonis]